MKKVLLSFSVLAVSGVIAQKSPKLHTFQDLIRTAPKTTVVSQPEEKSMTTLWQDNFNDPATWTIDNSGQSGIEFGWNINSTSDGWWSPNGISANGTSGGNNAELVNGDPTASPATQALNVVYTMTTATPINISSLGGSNQVSLQFKQFGARFNDLQEIQISTDGTNFTTVGDNLDKTVLSQSGGSAYPNPDTKLINLATFLPTNPTTVWIRFRWTTNYPGSASNANVWVAYGWYIDDVKILSNPDYDLSSGTTFWGSAGLNYYQIPTTQVAPIEMTAKVFNGGLKDLNGATLNGSVLSGATNVFTGASAPTNIASLDSADLTLSTTFTPPATVANYTLKRNYSLGTIPNGIILTGSVSDQGTGYVTGNGISLTGGTGTGATGNITATPLGTVFAGTVSDAGVYYTSATGVATVGGSGTGLTLNIVANPIVISNVIPNQQGSGYVDATNVPVSGGTGTGMTVDIIANFLTGIGSITINNPGTGYSNQDMLTVASGDNNGNFMIETTGGEITSATIASFGSGYQVGDVTAIIGSGQAYHGNFTVTSISGGFVTGLTISNPGTGYSVGDVLTVTGGTATYTVGTVTNNTAAVDEVPANNTIADVNFAVTNYIYARDNGTFSGSTSNGTIGFEAGNLFDIYQDQTLKGISFRLAGGSGGTTVGTEIYAKIYSIDPNTGDFVFMEETAPLVVASNNLNTILSLPLLNPTPLAQGETYLAVVGSFDGGLKISNAGTSDVSTTFFLDHTDDTWYYSTSTPVVRLNFDPVLAVDENTMNVSAAKVYPNPTANSATVAFSLTNASEVNVNVTDMSGKEVFAKNLGNLSTGENSTEINMAGMASGVYYVQLHSNGSVVTKKVIKN